MVPRSQCQASTAPSSSSTLPGRKRVGREGQAPFQRLRRRPPGCWVNVLLTGSHLCCGWGVACLRFRALAGSWSQILGAVHAEGRIPHPLQGFPSSPRSHPNIVSDMRAGSPWSLALCQVVLEVLSLAALEIILNPGPGLSSLLFLMEKITVAWCPVISLSPLSRNQPLSPERVCSAVSVHHSTVASALLSVQEGDFLASVNLSVECLIYPFFRIRGRFFWFLSVAVVDQFVEMCFGLSTALRSSPVLQESLRGLRPTRFLFSDTYPLAGPCLLGGHGYKMRSGSALALSLSGS